MAAEYNKLMRMFIDRGKLLDAHKESIASLTERVKVLEKSHEAEQEMKRQFDPPEVLRENRERRVRNNALEEAAQLCEDCQEGKVPEFGSPSAEGYEGSCAILIRKLKEGK